MGREVGWANERVCERPDGVKAKRGWESSVAGGCSAARVRARGSLDGREEGLDGAMPQSHSPAAQQGQVSVAGGGDWGKGQAQREETWGAKSALRRSEMRTNHRGTGLLSDDDGNGSNQGRENGRWTARSGWCGFGGRGGRSGGAARG